MTLRELVTQLRLWQDTGYGDKEVMFQDYGNPVEINKIQYDSEEDNIIIIHDLGI